MTQAPEKRQRGKRGEGLAMAFIKSHRSFDGDGCLIWPFSIDRSNGRGRVHHEGKSIWAHRAMCQEAHGPAPSPEHEASHSCGRGHDGCVHPKHLAWKTPTENQADRHLHGTAGKGLGYRFKLTPEKVAEIRSFKGSKTERDLAAMFGVRPQNIGMILRGETWKTGKYEFGGFRKVPFDRTGMTRS